MKSRGADTHNGEAEIWQGTRPEVPVGARGVDAMVGIGEVGKVGEGVDKLGDEGGEEIVRLAEVFARSCRTPECGFCNARVGNTKSIHDWVGLRTRARAQVNVNRYLKRDIPVRARGRVSFLVGLMVGNSDSWVNSNADSDRAEGERVRVGPKYCQDTYPPPLSITSCRVDYL